MPYSIDGDSIGELYGWPAVRGLLTAGVSAIFLLALLLGSARLGEGQTALRYFYDDAGQLYRALDSAGTLIEYTYDASGSITKVSRTSVPPSQLFILNVTPSNPIGGSTITIVGQNFSAVAAGDTVMIGGVAAKVISASTTQLVVQVPGGVLSGTVSVTVGGVTATWSSTITFPKVYDLSSDWSNSSNPNGPWSYNQGSAPLPFIPNWNANNTAWPLSCDQPAWAPSNAGGNFLPPILQLNACAAAGALTPDPNNPPQPNIFPGDLIVHTVDGFNGNPSLGAANVLFTLPASGGAGTYTITGWLWDAVLGATSSSRPQDWYVLLNGAQIATGHLSGAVSRSQAETFGVVGSLRAGDQVELQIAKDSEASAGFFVGIDLTITQGVTLGAAPQMITFGSLSNVTFGAAPITLSATATSGLVVSFASTTTGVCTVAGHVVTIVAGGACSITASQSGNAIYSSAPPVTQSFIVNVAPQTITFDAIPNEIFGISPFPIAARASSGLALSITSTTLAVCKTAGALVMLLKAGTCLIMASQPGNADYSAAASVTRSFTVNLAKPSGGFAAATGSPFTVGSFPRAMAVADFNGDGTQDLAIANQTSNNLTVLLGNGTGGFTPPTGSPFAVGSSPYSVVAGDFNGDGIQDLAIANGNSDSVTVLLGNGSGGFATATGSPYTVGSVPDSVVVGDFNGDGIQDLAVANGSDGNVTVLLGNGSGGFAAATGSPFAVGSFPQAISVGDFNGDGIQDLATANVGGNDVTVLLGNGSGGFTAAAGSPFTVGTGPQSVVVGDFNGDGIQDLATANYGSNNVTVLLGNGSGGFTAAAGSPFAVGTGPQSVVAGDFNGDGVQDLAIAIYQNNNLTILLGNGSGGFTSSTGGPFAVGTQPVFVVVGDFNGDGIQDLATANYTNNSVTVLLGTALGMDLVPPDASPASTRPRPATPSQGSPLRGSLPVLEPLEAIRSVTVGQTIRLGARNVDPRSIIEFDVNQVAIATVTEAPYETLFTIPDGPAELMFQAIVRAPGQQERLSQITRMTVVPDSGANIQGNVAQGTGGVELSLAAGGLKAEFFHLTQPVTALPSLSGVQPVRSGYVTAINEPNPGAVFGDDPLGAHLGFDYAVRFSGEVRADQPGQYRFWLTARSGAAILIDGELLADSGFVSGEPAETSAILSLDRGWHSIEVIYYLAVGDSSVSLDWQQPGSERREVLGPEYLRTVLSAMTTVSTADGTFAFPQVPRIFDTVWIRAKQGDGFIEFPAVTPGAGPVSITVPK